MDLITETQQHRLAALERVVSAPPVESPNLAHELAAAAMLIVGLFASVGALLASILGALWLLT